MPDRQNEALKLYLARAQWTPEAFARRLNSFARELGRIDCLDLKTPYKWLRGSNPRAPWPVLAAALISQELDERVVPGDLGWRGEHSLFFLPANAGLVVPWTASGALSTAKQVAETNPMDRRSFLLLVGAALTTPAHEWLIARPVTDASSSIGRLVSSELVEHLSAVTDRFRRMDDQGGGRALLDLVRAQINYVIQRLQGSRYTDLIGRQLHGILAELLRLAGWLAFDAGKQTEAQRFFIAALHGAHSAGDRQLGANVLGFMSCQAKDLGKHDEAIKLADTAIAGYRGASPRASAILHMRAAQAYAKSADATESRRSIEAAYSSFNDATPDHIEPDWCYWLDEAQINEQIGYCFLKLKDWPRASRHMHTAIRLQENSFGREGALRLALLADTYAQQGEPERACELGGQALEALASHVDSARCVGHIQNLREHLRPYRREPAVRDFGARVDQLRDRHAVC